MAKNIAAYIFRRKYFLYSSKLFIAAFLSWYGLKIAGIDNPIWAVITVFVVSDPSLTTTLNLSKVRTINTLVGCLFGLLSIFVFGYSPLISIVTACLTVAFVTMIERYPVNWRLAPVTVIILMDAARLAQSRTEEFHYVIMRVMEIGVGSAIALILAGIYTWIGRRVTPPIAQEDIPVPPTGSGL